MHENKSFLNLLRCGLWEEDINLPLFAFGKVNWQGIFELAQKQSVTGVVFDALKYLPAEFQLPKALYLQWCGLVAKIEANNEQMNKVVRVLNEALREDEISPILLKGQGVARYYRNPLRRISGDIDIYISPEEFDRAQLCLRDKGAELLAYQAEKHAEYRFQGEALELHHVMNRFKNPWVDARFRKEVARICAEDASWTNIGGHHVRVLPAEFELCYLLAHIQHHLLSEGIGLRQLCDWALLVGKQNPRHDTELHAALDVVRVGPYLRLFGLERIYGAVAFIAVRDLGLPEGCLPLPLRPRDSKNGANVWEVVWEGGNFGHFHPDSLRPSRKGVWGQLDSFLRVCRSCIRLFHLSPGEAAWVPLGKMWYFMRKNLSFLIL